MTKRRITLDGEIETTKASVPTIDVSSRQRGLRMEPPFGPIDPRKWNAYDRVGIHLHVYFDGVNVTQHCFYADDETGVIHRFKVRDGMHYKDPETGLAAQEVLVGRVEIRVDPAHRGPNGKCFDC